MEMFQWLSYIHIFENMLINCVISFLLINQRPVKFHLLDMDLQKLPQNIAQNGELTIIERLHTQTSPNKQKTNPSQFPGGFPHPPQKKA